MENCQKLEICLSLFLPSSFLVFVAEYCLQWKFRKKIFISSKFELAQVNFLLELARVKIFIDHFNILNSRKILSVFYIF